MTDGQGTTKLVTSSSQAITSTQETEAFGRTLATTGSTSTPFGYHGAAGYRQDGDGPAGLEPYQKVGARYYDATYGRFITRDTDLSQSPYAYCGGDPVNSDDPSGHNPHAGNNEGTMKIPIPATNNGNLKSTSLYPGLGSGPPSGFTGSVSTQGLTTTASITSAPVTLTGVSNNGQLTSFGTGSTIHIDNNLGITFTDSVSQTTASNSSSVGASLTFNNVTISYSQSSTGATAEKLSVTIFGF